ncbi:amidohydrolase [Rhodobacteraceae bacterium NNCM2]|nr:amidohydrolase [Coraliihabitans acroporae]
MPLINRFADLHADITEWRRDFHANPELMFDVHRTAGIVADKLRAFGCDEVVEGIGRTGVVGVIKGRETGSGKVIGMRADMDALPILEQTGKPYASTIEGKMHACGHDGHTAMLLGAAQYLSETRNFDGTVVVIFQPAEEGGGGGNEMVKDGMMERFGIQQVYGMHTFPGAKVGSFNLRPGPILASADEFTIELTGLGGHAAYPHDCIDTTLVGAQLLQALQTIVARNVDPVKSAVLSVTMFETDTNASNVIAETMRLHGTVRTLDPEVQDMVEAKMHRMVEHLPQAFDARAELTYTRSYPVTSSTEAEAAFAASVAAEVAGEALVDANSPPQLGAEDFSFMLNARPGAFIFLGNGDTAGCHHPAFDFDDEAIPAGCSFWARLAEKGMPLKG